MEILIVKFIPKYSIIVCTMSVTIWKCKELKLHLVVYPYICLTCIQIPHSSQSQWTFTNLIHLIQSLWQIVQINTIMCWNWTTGNMKTGTVLMVGYLLTKNDTVIILYGINKFYNSEYFYLLLLFENTTCCF